MTKGKGRKIQFRTFKTENQPIIKNTRIFGINNFRFECPLFLGLKYYKRTFFLAPLLSLLKRSSDVTT